MDVDNMLVENERLRAAVEQRTAEQRTAGWRAVRRRAAAPAP